MTLLLRSMVSRRSERPEPDVASATGLLRRATLTSLNVCSTTCLQLWKAAKMSKASLATPVIVTMQRRKIFKTFTWLSCETGLTTSGVGGFLFIFFGGGGGGWLGLLRLGLLTRVWYSYAHFAFVACDASSRFVHSFFCSKGGINSNSTPTRDATSGA